MLKHTFIAWQRVVPACLAASALLAWSSTASAQARQGAASGGGQTIGAPSGSSRLNSGAGAPSTAPGQPGAAAGGGQTIGAPSGSSRLNSNTGAFSAGQIQGSQGGANPNTAFRPFGAAGPGNPSGNVGTGSTTGNAGTGQLINSAFNPGGTAAFGNRNIGTAVAPNSLFGTTAGNPLAAGNPAAAQPQFNLNPNASAVGGFNNGFVNGANAFQQPFVGSVPNLGQAGLNQFQRIGFIPTGSAAQFQAGNNALALSGAFPVGQGSFANQQQLIDAMMLFPVGNNFPNQLIQGTGTGTPPTAPQP